MTQQDQEPVQWGVDWGRAGETPCVSIIKRRPDGGIEVIAVEYGPPSKPLSWERVLEIGIECANDSSRLPFEVKVARAVEAAHGIK